MTAYGTARSSPSGTFTATDNGGRWVFEGPLTMDDAARALDEADELPPPSDGIVDFRGLLQVDSLLPRFFEVQHRGIRYT